MSLIDARTTRVLFTVLLFALALGFFYIARRTLSCIPVCMIFFAYLVDPAVSRVEKLVRGRGRAIAVIYALLVALLITFFFFVGPQIARQAQRLSESLPKLLETVQFRTNCATDRKGSRLEVEAYHGAQVVRVSGPTTAANFGDLAQNIGLRVADVCETSLAADRGTDSGCVFLKDARTFGEVLLSFVHSRPQREFLEGVLGDLNQMLAQFIRAQLMLAALSFIAYLAFLAIARVPYALVLGTAGGLMEFIPVVGPLVAATVILSVALLMSYPHWIILLIFLAAWRMLQDYVISPRIMGQSMELHPLAAIFGVLAGGEIAGVLGIYLSIPIMASLRIVWRRWRLYAEKKRFGPLNDYSFGAEIVPGK